MNAKNILLIEDNLDVRENLTEILELSNYKVFAAENGKVGVELAKKHIPDLIVCDIMMPELDGYGVLHVLSKSPETASIPFIFLTAKTEKTDIRKGMNLGADDYLTKPFDDIELLDAIEIRLRKHELVRKQSGNTIEDYNQMVQDARSLHELDQLISDERRINKYKKKQIVYSEGNVANALYFLVKGKVKTYKTNDDGREYITALHKEGDYIGYVNLLEDASYNDSAMAMEDSEICVIPKQEFFALLYSNIHIAEKFIRLLSNNVKENEERLIKLAYNSVRKRVAESLLMIFDEYQTTAKGTKHITASRDDLASIVGASKETVIRTLSDFKDEGLVQLSGSNITILDEKKLRHMRN
ncbi:MAG: response regulator [Cytophagaceae bacterium]|jgi:CRP-like cAMP-binding protein|nr:response regulator [Cytophagaceae bacterium]